jgi:hypothetical protein
MIISTRVKSRESYHGLLGLITDDKADEVRMIQDLRWLMMARNLCAAGISYKDAIKHGACQYNESGIADYADYSRYGNLRNPC